MISKFQWLTLIGSVENCDCGHASCSWTIDFSAIPFSGVHTCASSFPYFPGRFPSIPRWCLFFTCTRNRPYEITIFSGVLMQNCIGSYSSLRWILVTGRLNPLNPSLEVCFHVVAQYLYLQQSQILRLCIFPNHPMNQVALVSLFDDLDLQARRIGPPASSPPAFSPHPSAWIQITVSDPKIPDFKSLVRFDTWSTEGERPPGWRINQRYKYPLCAHSSTQKN